MSDLCEIEQKMKTPSRHLGTVLIAGLGIAFARDYLIDGMHMFDLMCAIGFLAYSTIIWRTK